MTWLITSDLHLSDRPRDEYRFGIFQWLRKQQEKHAVTGTFILGDLTDLKDRHSAALVNRLVNELSKLHRPIYIPKGNHDFVDPANPYFKFLNELPGIMFISDPTYIAHDGYAFIPHQGTQKALDDACREVVSPQTRAIFLHNTFEGALSEGGTRLSGLRWPLAASNGRAARGVWSGDVHRPQRHDNGVTYVGAPYAVRFGDNFNPRVLLVNDGVETDLHFPAPRKWTISIDAIGWINEGILKPGDQVKVELVLLREDVHNWGRCKAEIVARFKNLGVEVHGFKLTVPPTVLTERTKLSPQAKTYDEIVMAFGKAEAVTNGLLQVGRELVRHS